MIFTVEEAPSASAKVAAHTAIAARTPKEARIIERGSAVRVGRSGCNINRVVNALLP